MLRYYFCQEFFFCNRAAWAGFSIEKPTECLGGGLRLSPLQTSWRNDTPASGVSPQRFACLLGLAFAGRPYGRKGGCAPAPPTQEENSRGIGGAGTGVFSLPRLPPVASRFFVQKRLALKPLRCTLSRDPSPFGRRASLLRQTPTASLSASKKSPV